MKMRRRGDWQMAGSSRGRTIKAGAARVSSGDGRSRLQNGWRELLLCGLRLTFDYVPRIGDFKCLPVVRKKSGAVSYIRK